MRIASRCHPAMRCATTNNSDFGRHSISHAQESRNREFSQTKRKLKMQRATCTHLHTGKQGFRAWQRRCAGERRRGRDGLNEIPKNATENPHQPPNRPSRLRSLHIHHLGPPSIEKIAQNSRRHRGRGAVPAVVWEGRGKKGERARNRAMGDGDDSRSENGRRAFRRSAMAGCRMIDNEVHWGREDVELANHIIWPDAGFWGGADLNPGPKGESVEALGDAAGGREGGR